ncbi:MAG: hypothetical protein H9W81_02560 [Enterococcus sp.]|nr:hypothetical protein [Enterococcus sp.]
MPARYESILGYGLKYVPNYDAYEDDEWLSQDFDGTVEDRYPALIFQGAGDLWNGGEEERYVFAKSSVIKHRSNYGDTSGWGKEISLPGPVPREEITELWRFISDLSISEGNITWHLITFIG